MTQVSSPSAATIATAGATSDRGTYDHDRRWWAFATLSVAVFISILDLFIVNIAFPDIERQWPDAGLSGLSYAVAATFLFFAGFAALLLGGVLFLTQVWHYSILRAGLAFAPGPLMAALFAAPGGRLTARYGPGIVGFAGGVLFAFGALMQTRLPATPDYVAHYLPFQLIGGAGVGLILPTFTSAAVLAVPAERLTTGIAAETTFRQIGAALAIAAWVAIYGTPSAAGVLDAFDRGYAYMAGCSLAAAITLLILARKGAPTDA